MPASGMICISATKCSAQGVKAPHLDDQWTYLRKVVRGKCAVDPLSSIDLNLIVVDILDQARHLTADSRVTN